MIFSDEKVHQVGTSSDPSSEALTEESTKAIVPKSRRDFRILAFYLIYAIERGGYTASVEETIESFRKEWDIVIPPQSFSYDIASGVTEKEAELDKYYEPYLEHWDINRLGCCTKIILRMGIWELLHSDHVPSIIINEAVELAKYFAEKDSYRFVNGILDKINKNLHPEEEDKSDCSK